MILSDNLPPPDLKIICENNVPIFCHQTVLAGSSAYLRSIFKSISVKYGDDSFRQSDDVTIYCVDVGSDSLIKSLQLLYDGGTLISSVNKKVTMELKYVLSKVLFIDILKLTDRDSVTAIPVDGTKVASRNFSERKSTVHQSVINSEEVVGNEIVSNVAMGKVYDQEASRKAVALEEVTTPPPTITSKQTFFSLRETSTQCSTLKTTIKRPKSTPIVSGNSMAFRNKPTPPSSLSKKSSLYSAEKSKEIQISGIISHQISASKTQSIPSTPNVNYANDVLIQPDSVNKKRKFNPFEEHLRKEIAKRKATKLASKENVPNVPENGEIFNITKNIINIDKFGGSISETLVETNSNSKKPTEADDVSESSSTRSTPRPSNQLKSPIGEIFNKALKTVPNENKTAEPLVVSKTNISSAPAYSVETIHTCYICRGMKDGKRDPDAEISFSAFKKLKEHYGKHFYNEGLIFEYFEVGDSNKNPDGSIKDQFGKVKKYKCEEKNCWKGKKPACGYKEMALHMSSEHGIFEKIIEKDSRQELHKLMNEIKEHSA